AGFEPLNPKNIVFAGNSAGGGLSLALGLAIRDAGLPSSAVSMPSIINDECADFLPNLKSGLADKFTESQASKEYKEKDAAFAAKIKNQNLGPKIWHDSFNRPDGRLQLYVANEGLAIPYVSP
ncbi:4707_t:CDS:2, partial [Rhizophagus irregularis]